MVWTVPDSVQDYLEVVAPHAIIRQQGFIVKVVVEKLLNDSQYPGATAILVFLLVALCYRDSWLIGVPIAPHCTLGCAL